MIDIREDSVGDDVMAEQTFRSPGFFEQEIELVAGTVGPQGTPAGIAGTSLKGPAFVPVTVGTYADFKTRFGDKDPERPAVYAAEQWLRHRGALTFVRVLGAGANTSTAHISTTLSQGTVRNAGFRLSPYTVSAGLNHTASEAALQFIVARHFVSASGGQREEMGFPIFTDNPTFGISGGATSTVNLVRGVVFAASGSRVQVMGYDESYGANIDDGAYLGPETGSTMVRKFKIAVSSSVSTFVSSVSTDGNGGVRIYTASLDPADDSYISKVLNTNPDLFDAKKHLLYLDFPVEKEVVPVQTGSSTDYTVGVLSGTSNLTNFGRFDTRYTTPRTPSFISQPFGKQEYDLFYFESISDGEYANNRFKVSIQNLRASTDPAHPYGTFDVVLRAFDDDDIVPEELERYTRCSLDPTSADYVARKVGDKKVYFNFDADEVGERRLVISGKYPNKSTNFRVVMDPLVENRKVPAGTLPFGFRGVPVMKTSDSLADYASSLTFENSSYSTNTYRLDGFGITGNLLRSVVPPLPYRFKVTKGALSQNTTNIGEPGTNERADSRLHWGVVNKTVPLSSSISDAIMNANAGTLQNPLVASYAKYQGISKLDTVLTGSAVDVFNANKFTLARVALANATVTAVTGTAELHMKDAAYVRNGQPDGTNYSLTYGGQTRVTLATLVASSSVVFNRFTPYAKFTGIFYGGFDGLNILNSDNRKMNDKSSSTESSTTANGGSGLALGAVEAGLTTNAAGTGVDNNIVASYRAAARILTDEFSSNANVVAIPGIREPLVQDYLSSLTRDYSLAIHIRDIPSYDDSATRLWDDSTAMPSVRYVSENFTGLNVDNNYSSTYYPDVYVDDTTNMRLVKVPASVAVLGALAYNDKVAYPWFAPAGFNRGALDFVKNVVIRLNSGDRDMLYESRINPIAVFPTGGYVVFGQKTLQSAKSALDRVNVRRLMVEVKRAVKAVADSILFEQNNSTTRAKFVKAVTPLLTMVQAQSGIEKFRVVMDDSNNTSQDVEANRLNGRVVVVPTRAIEFIAIDFVVTPSGVAFI